MASQNSSRRWYLWIFTNLIRIALLAIWFVFESKYINKYCYSFCCCCCYCYSHSCCFRCLGLTFKETASVIIRKTKEGWSAILHKCMMLRAYSEICLRIKLIGRSRFSIAHDALYDIVSGRETYTNAKPQPIHQTHRLLQPRESTSKQTK